MERLDQLRLRIGSIAELREIVGAMRFSAASHTQQAQAALTGIREYVGVVIESVSEALALLPEAAELPRRTRGQPRRRLVVLGAEHGFVGSFSEALIERALQEVSRRPAELFMVGRRTALHAEERGLKATWTGPMASHVEGVLETARRIAVQLFQRADSARVSAIDTIFARYEGGGLHRIELRSLLPLDLAAFSAAAPGGPPLHNLPPDLLLEKLLDEYLLAQLTMVTMESLASENGARLHAMGEAHDKIETRLRDLRQKEHELRQEAITLELLEVVTGSAAVLD